MPRTRHLPQTDDFSFVSRLPQLQEICFNTVAKLTAAPDFSRNTKLHTAEFFNCKHLAALGTLPPLHSLSLTFSQVPFPQIEAAARSGSLKKFYFQSAKAQETRQFEQLADELGLEQ